MREIKFRGKRKDTGKWVYGYLFKTPLTVENFEAGFIDGPERLCISSDDIGIVYEIIKGTECQYTGEKDKAEKEIYENDILAVSLGKRDGFTGAVIWHNNGWKLKNVSDDEYFKENPTAAFWTMNYAHDNNSVIIGNTIDKPFPIRKEDNEILANAMREKIQREKELYDKVLSIIEKHQTNYEKYRAGEYNEKLYIRNRTEYVNEMIRLGKKENKT